MLANPQNTCPIVTFCLFRFEGRKDKWWAFREMGLAYDTADVPGLLFFKKVGTGGSGGFSVLPNLSVYGWLLSWENEQAAQAFLSENPYFLSWKEKSVDNIQIFMTNIRVHGTWHRQTPFTPITSDLEPGQIAVITRARVKWKQLVAFWRQVPAINRRMAKSQGRIFSVGFGELPILELATFSIWDGEESMKTFAYGSEKHQKAIKDTRRLDWYSEELFSRFRVYKKVGDWPGLS